MDMTASQQKKKKMYFNYLYYCREVTRELNFPSTYRYVNNCYSESTEQSQTH